MEIGAIEGGDPTPKMANAILNFHFFYIPLNGSKWVSESLTKVSNDRTRVQ